MTLRTIFLGSGTLAQGILEKPHGARNFHTGQFEPNGRVTISVGGIKYTGKLVPTLIKRGAK